MELNVPELEQRLLNLQWQVERLWQMAEVNVQPVDKRLTGMVEQYSENLKRWAVTAERHAQAVSQLESYVSDWKDASGRIQQDTSERLRELEATIHLEWEELKKLHEQPAKELREQATNLTEVCIATASVAQQGFDRTETRLASFENDVHRRLSEFVRDVQSAIAELKSWPQQQPARLDGAAPWSLDDVTRLHTQLRNSSEGEGAGTADMPVNQPGGLGLRELPPAIAAEVEQLRRVREGSPHVADDGGQTIAEVQPPSDQSVPWKWRLALAGLGLAVIIAVGFGWSLRNEMLAAAERAQQAELDSQRAAADAARQAAVAREEAARQISSAREMANRAERIGNVLAAPDLIRYNLSGGNGAPAAYGQALWSRTRGFVFSGSRMPPPPPQGMHQLWLLTRFAPVKASRFVPEADGTVTIVEQGLNVPRAVVGVMVTAEAAGAGDSPTGEPILSSLSSAQ